MRHTILILTVHFYLQKKTLISQLKKNSIDTSSVPDGIDLHTIRNVKCANVIWAIGNVILEWIYVPIPSHTERTILWYNFIMYLLLRENDHDYSYYIFKSIHDCGFIFYKLLILIPTNRHDAYSNINFLNIYIFLRTCLRDTTRYIFHFCHLYYKNSILKFKKKVLYKF